MWLDVVHTRIWYAHLDSDSVSLVEMPRRPNAHGLPLVGSRLAVIGLHFNEIHYLDFVKFFAGEFYVPGTFFAMSF